MNNAEIKERFQMTIDQYYSHPNEQYIRENQMHFIGGVLQAALHILPWNDYHSLKVYCFEQHRYDPGGVSDCRWDLDGQMNMDEWIGVKQHDSY